MPSTSLTTRPVHAARRACVALRLRHLTLQEERERGQGTVEYVALILLIGAIMAAVVGSGAGKHFDLANTIGNKLKGVVSTVGDAKK